MISQFIPKLNKNYSWISKEATYLVILWPRSINQRSSQKMNNTNFVRLTEQNQKEHLTE